MISYIDGQARVPSNSNFSALIFGYGMTYYRLNYEYDSKVLTQINKTYKAIFDNTTGGRVLPVHQYTVGSAGGTATPTK